MPASFPQLSLLSSQFPCHPTWISRPLGLGIEQNEMMGVRASFRLSVFPRLSGRLSRLSLFPSFGWRGGGGVGQRKNTHKLVGVHAFFSFFFLGSQNRLV